MFGIGFGEMVLLFIIVIIFVKPSEYKDVWRTLGKLTKQIQNFVESVNKSIKY